MSELLKSILYHNPEFRKQVSDSPLMRAKIQMAEQRLRIDIAKLFIELGEPPLGDDIENIMESLSDDERDRLLLERMP